MSHPLPNFPVGCTVLSQSFVKDSYNYPLNVMGTFLGFTKGKETKCRVDLRGIGVRVIPCDDLLLVHDDATAQAFRDRQYGVRRNGSSKGSSSLEQMFDGYREAVLLLKDDKGQRLNRTFSVSDFSEEANAAMLEDCASFLEENTPALRQLMAHTMYDWHLIGENFFLYRNGLNQTCFDAEAAAAKPATKRLREAAKAAGTQNVYVGDDGELHVA